MAPPKQPKPRPKSGANSPETTVAYWLMKSEPEVFSIDRLKTEKKTLWDGVRNYQARNFMQKEMKVGDLVLFYHSNAKPSGIAGLAVVCKEAEPDPTQFDPKSEAFDPKSKIDAPRWYGVSVKYRQKFRELIPLERLKSEKALKNMVLLNNSRLSVQPVRKSEYEHILKIVENPTRKS